MPVALRGPSPLTLLLITPLASLVINRPASDALVTDDTNSLVDIFVHAPAIGV